MFAAEVPAAEIAKAIFSSQNDPAKLCSKSGFFRAGGGTKCAERIFGPIAYAMCNKYADFSTSGCADLVTKKGELSSPTIFEAAKTVFTQQFDETARSNICDVMKQANNAALASAWGCK
jgi:hypothetical protein